MSSIPMDLSVVIPSYNRAEELLVLLGSLAGQACEAAHFEVIVVLDGSSDGSSRIVASRRWPFPLRVIEQPNRGAGAARTAGALAASAPLIAFLDDDMNVDPSWCAALLTAARNFPGAILVGMIRTTWNAKGMVRRGDGFWREFERRADGDALTFRACCSGNLAVPAQVFRSLGGFRADLRRIEDFEFGFRAQRAGVPLRFARQAAAVQTVSKTVDAVLNNARNSGEAAVTLWRQAPEFLAAQGSGFRRPTRRPVASLLRAAIALPLPRQFERWAGGLESRAGVRQVQTALWYREYLTGSKRACANIDEWYAFLARAQEPDRDSFLSRDNDCS